MKYWVSHPKFTGQVTVLDDVICSAPAVWGVFVGQKFEALKRWLNSLGPGLDIQEL